MKLEIAATDLTSEADAAALLTLLDAYARDPMGGAKPLADDVKARLVPDLRERIARGASVVLIARRGGAPQGVAVCHVGYSTFRARRVFNLHDLAVLPESRGAGIGRALLATVEAQASSRDCALVTLEVREDNTRARRLYEHVGFVDYSPGGARTRTFFLEKVL